MEQFMQQVLQKLDMITNDISGLKQDVSGLKQDMGGLKEEQRKTNERLDRIEKKLDATYDQTAELTEFRTETKQSFSDIKDTLRFVLNKEIETEKEIYLLKNKKVAECK